MPLRTARLPTPKCIRDERLLRSRCTHCNLVPRAFSSTIFKMVDRHFENRRGEGPGNEVGTHCILDQNITRQREAGL